MYAWKQNELSKAFIQRMNSREPEESKSKERSRFGRENVRIQEHLDMRKTNLRLSFQ